MSETSEIRHTLGELAARQLANTTKTAPQMRTITPRWLIACLPWVPVEAGTYRVNQVIEARAGAPADVECSPQDESDLPEIYVDYQEQPREFTLSAMTTVLDVQTRVSDLYRSPYDQIREQLRLTIEKVKEKQEAEIINNPDYGLLSQVADSFRVQTRDGTPTPDDLDELIARVWKEPAFFLAHPRAIAAFGRECTYRGVPPATVNLFGSPFITWRGIPLIPSDKLYVNDNKTSILAAAHRRKAAGGGRLVPAGIAG